MRKFLKWIFVFGLIIIIPALILIIVLFVDNQNLLFKLQEWLKTPGNLSAFIVILSSYLPIVTFVWNFILLSTRSSLIKRELSKFKQNQNSKILYEDESRNYIIYYPESNKLEVSMKSKKPVDLKQLAKIVANEILEKSSK